MAPWPIVPGSTMAGQAIPSHRGAVRRAVHVRGRQHTDGTHSASVLHAPVPGRSMSRLGVVEASTLGIASGVEVALGVEGGISDALGVDGGVSDAVSVGVATGVEVGDRGRSSPAHATRTIATSSRPRRTTVALTSR